MKRLFYQLVLLLLLSGCQLSTGITNTSRTPEQGHTVAPVLVTTTERVHSSETETSTSSPQPTTTFTEIPPPTSTQAVVDVKTKSPTSEFVSKIRPTIHEGEEEYYSVLFSIPVGAGAKIKYRGSGFSEMNGPDAIGVLPDESIVIADIVSNCLFQYNQVGQLLRIIDLEEVGIFNVVDLRVKGDEIYLLEISGARYRVDKITANGELISSDEFSPNFSIGQGDWTLANVLTGMAIDCEGNVLLEARNGSELFRFNDIKNNKPLSEIVKDYFCDGKKYRVINPVPMGIPKVIAGNISVETELTTGLGGFQLLDVLNDGSLYVIRDDVVDQHVIKVDKTVHFIDANGVAQGMARIPASEFLYYIMRSVAIDAIGEILALVPRPNSIDIVRLIFYKQLEPLIPEAVKPNIISSKINP